MLPEDRAGHYLRQSGTPRKESSILTPGAATMALLTWDTKNTIVSINERMNLPVRKNISMTLNGSGRSPNLDP
jgi:hypothetical protein